MNTPIVPPKIMPARNSNIAAEPAFDPVAQTDQAKTERDQGHRRGIARPGKDRDQSGQFGKLAGFHFNDSKYGDDDLTTGSIKPYQLFLIFLELLDAGGGRMPELAYLIDQSNNLKDPLEDLMQATDAMQIALAQALLVDQQALRAAQDANDPALSQEILHRAFRTDVRPLVAQARQRNGAALDPIATYRALGYRAEKIRERGLYAVATGI